MSVAKKPKRMLYLHPSLMPPSEDLRRDRFYHLSEGLEGDVLQAVWYREPAEIEAHFGPGSYPVYQCGDFRYHWFLAYRYGAVESKLRTLKFFLLKGIELHNQSPYDCIGVYSHMTTSLIGVFLKWWTGAQLIIEIMTAPHLVYLCERPQPGWKDHLRKLYSDLLLHINVLASDCTHLLYPGQLDHYPLLKKSPVSSFHEFVPVSEIKRQVFGEERYLFMVGSPWYLKGADLLVRAYLRIRVEFPGLKLRMQGHFTNHGELDALIGGCPDIEIFPPAANTETVKQMGQAILVVHPSRCEGLPRVLIEALAAGVATVGSDAGGIPFLVRHGENGLVFHLGDVDGLVESLRRVLKDEALRERMGQRGYDIAHQELTEQVYVKRFVEMVERTVQDMRRQ